MDPATPTPNPPQPKPRVRSDAQLNRKRLTDRIKQKENRNENKQRLEKIESSIVSIQDRLESLVVQLQNNTPLALSVPTASIHSPQVVSDQSLPALHSTYGSHTPQPLLANSSSLPWSGQGHHTPPQAPPDTGTGITKIWGYTPSQHRPSSRILNCRCGLQHPDHFDCLETCNVTTLYRRHLGVAGTESASPFPRNPSLACMMLHQGDESILTFFITGYLQQCRTKSIEQLLAFYFLAYRYMRWQMHPNANTVQDIPVWMLPTEAQKTHAHSVVVDFLAWPRLRDYICMSGDTDPRHSVEFYFESIQLRWPPDRPLFAQGDTGQIVLSPVFESTVFDLDNWNLGPPWADAFPHLMHLIHA